MSIKKFVMVVLASAFLIPASLQSLYAYDPNWKETQDKVFAQIGLKPGDVINTANYKKIEGLVPDGILNWVKKGEWTIKIGKLNYDFSPDKQYLDDSKKNAGKYKIVANGKSKYMVEASTGEIPKYVYGHPFPDVDVKNDPDGVIKFMYNAEAEMSRAGSQWNYSAAMDWIGTGGYERTNVLDWIKYSFWQRPDGEQDNPHNYKFLEMIPCSKPFDSKGIVSMFYRMADGGRDKVYSYLPMMRRVKRLSGANRSDPTLGSDTCMDDAGGWSGDNCSMKWKYIDEKITLMPIMEVYADHPKPFSREPDGSWFSDLNQEDSRLGWMDPSWQGVPWALLNVVWVPRETYIVVATPLDPYYAYGKTDLYMDKDSGINCVKVVYNKAMEYWKTIMVGLCRNDWDNRQTFVAVNYTVGVDDRTHHASNVHSNGSHMNEPECRQRFMAPQVNRAMFTPAKLKIWSK